MIQPIHTVVVTLIPQRQYYNNIWSKVALTLDNKLSLRCTMNIVLEILLYHDVEFTTSSQHRFRTSTSQRCTNIASMLDGKFTCTHLADAIMSTSIQHCNRKVRFTTSSRRWYYEVAKKLRQSFKELKVWTRMIAFPHPCLNFSPLFPSRSLKDPKKCFGIVL